MTLENDLSSLVITGAGEFIWI